MTKHRDIWQMLRLWRNGLTMIMWQNHQVLDSCRAHRTNVEMRMRQNSELQKSWIPGDVFIHAQLLQNPGAESSMEFLTIGPRIIEEFAKKSRKLKFPMSHSHSHSHTLCHSHWLSLSSARSSAHHTKFVTTSRETLMKGSRENTDFQLSSSSLLWNWRLKKKKNVFAALS